MPNRSHTAAQPIDRFSRLVLGVVTVVWLLALLGGGSARADVLYVAPLRAAAIAGVALLFIALPRERFRVARAPLVFLSLVTAVVAIQLIPLPHDVWTALPGRSAYDGLQSVPDIGNLWRPISLAPDLTWNTLVSIAPPFFMAIALPLLERRARSWVLMAILATIMASALLGMLQLAGGETSNLRWYHFTNESSAVGLFANRNHEAVFLAMGIPILAWWATKTAGRSRPGARLAVAAAGTLFLLVAVATSQSRMGLFVAGIALVLSVGYVLSQTSIPKRALPWIGGAILLVAGLTAAGLSHWSTNRLSVSGVEDDLRLRIFPETMEAARTYFPVGAGFGTFPNVFRRFESVEDLDPSYVNHTHSEPTQLLIEGGIFSIILATVFFIWYCRTVVRAWRGYGGRTSDEAKLASILVALPMIGSFTDYPVRAPLLSCTLAIAATLLHISSQSPGSSR